MTPAPTAPSFRIAGWHVLVAMLVFFGVVIAVDTAFVFAAYRTYPGEVAVTPYEDGLDYNRTVARRKAQAALGWSASAGAEDGAVTVEIRDAAGAPVSGLKVKGALRRPATETGKIELAFVEVEPGRYAAAVKPDAGAWDLSVTATGSGPTAFEAERRLTWR
jgi:nitrogen fixation protein FixH